MRYVLSITVLAVAIAPAWAQMLSSHAAAPSVAQPKIAAAPSPTGKPVARVNGAVLTYGDLLREEYTIFPYARQHNGQIPAAMQSDIEAGAMKMIVFEELVYQEAKRRGMTVPPAKLQRAEGDFRKQFATPQEYQDLVRSEFKGSIKLLQAKIERSLLIDQLLKTDISDRSSITLAQLHTYYDQNPQQFRIPESFAVQTISVIPPANATIDQQKAARKKAEDDLRQAQATKSYEEFGVLAEKLSEDDFRVMMGDHRAVDQTKLPSQVVDVVKTMQSGQISGLIELEDHAYTIVRLNAHISAGEQKFETVKDSLREQLKRKKAEQLRHALDTRLRKNAKVEEL